VNKNTPDRTRKPKGRKAWLVRWEWAGKHAAVEQPVVAILSPRLSGQRVRQTVEMLYASLSCTPDEMLEAAFNGDSKPHRAQFNTISVHLDGREVQVPWSGEVVCGHNPFLVARKARVWPLRDGSGGVRWEDDPRPTVVGTRDAVAKGR
jgi:hypothetical protein